MSETMTTQEREARGEELKVLMRLLQTVEHEPDEDDGDPVDGPEARGDR